MKPHALVANDDGIESAFLHRFVDALCQDFDVTVAAPAFEQSWIGRAISRNREIEVIHSPSIFPRGVDAWAISGTPTDCVNIALGHLVKRPVDIVLSGINIGYNTGEILILSSGTIAAAIEGASWGLPAVAFSKCVPNHLYEGIRESKGKAEGGFKSSLIAASRHASSIALETLKKKPPHGTVLNVNFPADTRDNTSCETTVPAKVQMGSLYVETSPGKYVFNYTDGITFKPDNLQTDRFALEHGKISLSILNFACIGKRTHTEEEQTN